MTSEDTDWLKNNFGSEPDVAFPGYYGVEELPGSIKNEIINLKPQIYEYHRKYFFKNGGMKLHQQSF